MKQENSISTSIIRIIKRLVSIIHRLGEFRKRLNNKIGSRYSPTLIGISVAVISGILLMIMLFVPPYLGVADDGTVEKVMNSAGIYYIQDESNDIYSNYYVRTYYHTPSSMDSTTIYKSGQVILLKAATFLDDLVTKDQYFDMRFLALIYGLFFIPAIGILVKQAAQRVLYFSEGIVIGIFGILIFTDVSYVTYFSSFYPEAIWFITFLYCVGAGLSLHNKGKNVLGLFTFTLAGILLCTSRKQCALIGFLLAVYALKALFLSKGIRWKFLCAFSSVVLSITAICSMIYLDEDFTITSKYHAMTRGVLFQSENPEKTLELFGIYPSYSVLTDASAYEDYPFVEMDHTILKENFLDLYTTADVLNYYFKHPKAMVGMLDLSVKAAFNIRRSYCGNYEKSVGLPEKAQSLFFSAWSTFKVRSAPKTIGYFIILMIASFILYGKKYSVSIYMNNENRISTVLLDTMVLIMGISLLQAVITIVKSGDAEFAQHGFLVGVGIDMLTYFIFAEILHKLNIIEEGGKK